MPASMLMVSVDNVFVHLRAARDVIRLHGQHFLQGVCSAIGFQRPHFHFTEALAAELSLTAQRLLGNETVRTGRTRVHLVIHQSGSA